MAGRLNLLAEPLDAIWGASVGRTVNNYRTVASGIRIALGGRRRILLNMDPHVLATILDHSARSFCIVDVDAGEVFLVIPDKEDRTQGWFIILFIVKPDLSRRFRVEATKSLLKITIILDYLLSLRIKRINELSSVDGNTVPLKGRQEPNVKSLILVSLYVGVVCGRTSRNGFAQFLLSELEGFGVRDQKFFIDLVSQPRDLSGAIDDVMKDLIEFVVFELAIDRVPNAFRILKTEPLSPEAGQLGLVSCHYKIACLPGHLVISDKPLHDLKLLIEAGDIKGGFGWFRSLPKDDQWEENQK